jgi:hypothetical protein
MDAQKYINKSKDRTPKSEKFVAKPQALSQEKHLSPKKRAKKRFLPTKKRRNPFLSLPSP